VSGRIETVRDQSPVMVSRAAAGRAPPVARDGTLLAERGRMPQHRAPRRAVQLDGALHYSQQFRDLTGDFTMKKTRLSWVVAVVGAVALAGCGQKDAAAPSDATASGEAAAAPKSESKVVNVYNWSDYIAEDTLAKFTEETGIKVVYDVFDSNDVVEAKLLAGNTGYDVVVPSAHFLGRQINAGVFMPLDKSKIPNYANLDAAFMANIAKVDPGNRYAVPYLWGTTGIGYNPEKVKEALGEDAPVDSWDLIFKPENLAKLSKCGVSILDEAAEVIPTVLNYLGKDPNDFKANETLVPGEVQALLMQLRPYVTYFHSSKYINDLANGDICVALGWSGDIFQAATRAEEAANGVTVEYVIPKEGAGIWVDMLAIPKDAKNADNAHAFINFLLQPEIMAGITNYVWYANGVPASRAMINKEILDHPGIYPSEETQAKMFTFAVVPPELDRIYTRTWTTVKTGK
jgi:putrescine transport system substrate-binding protein